MITLYNQIDIRSGKHYSVVVISEKNARYFEPIPEEIPASKKVTKKKK